MATTTNFGWETPDDTDLVKDGAAAIRTLGQSIDTSMMDLEGGTTGQVLSKASNADMDFTWVTSDDANAIQNAIVDAKGDLIAATAADTPARLAVGTNGHVLTADSAQATGLKWAAASSAFNLITTQAISGAGTYNFDNVFTSTYSNYRFIFNGKSSGNDYMNLQLRASGSNNSTANYQNYLNRWTGANASQLNQTQINSSTLGTLAGFVSIDLYRPQKAVETQWYQISQGWNSASSVEVREYVGVFNGTNQFDGLRFFMDSGTVAGTIWIYGYGD